MTDHRPLRSRIAARIAELATIRGGAPVIVVPGDVDGVDMRAVVSGLASAMGYDVRLMMTAGFKPTAGFFAQPQPSTLAASERGRMHVLDERTGPADNAGNDDFTSAAIIRHLDSGGGMPTSVVVITRGGVEAVKAHAASLGRMLTPGERQVVFVD